MSAAGGRETALEHVKYNIRIFSLAIMVINFVFLFSVVRLTYEFLDYMPVGAMLVFLAFSAILATAMLYAAKAASAKAIRAIDEFGRKLGELLESSKKIHEIGYSDMLIDSMMESALKMTGAEGCSLLLVEGDSLVFRNVKGGKSGFLTGVSIPRDKGIAARVVATGYPVRVDDASKDGRFYPVVDEAIDYATRSVLCVPLKAGAEVIGALEIVNKGIGAFTAEDEEIMTYFAGHAANSLEKAKFSEDEKNYEIHFTGILLEAVDNIMPEKRGHSKRVAKYSLFIADALGLREDEKRCLYRACMLHDIGFLRVRPEDLISVKDYRSHPQHAREMLSPINFYSDIVPIILHHHERYDGKGYPDGLAGETIPAGSRIIAIAEAFDAMASPYSYKNVGKMVTSDVIQSVVDFDGAVEELRKNAGTQFDPKIVDIFVKNITPDDVE